MTRWREEGTQTPAAGQPLPQGTPGVWPFRTKLPLSEPALTACSHQHAPFCQLSQSHCISKASELSSRALVCQLCPAEPWGSVLGQGEVELTGPGPLILCHLGHCWLRPESTVLPTGTHLPVETSNRGRAQATSSMTVNLRYPRVEGARLPAQGGKASGGDQGWEES